MSFLASFYVVAKERVPALTAEPSLHDELREVGWELPDFEWSGYAFAVLLSYLDDKGVAMRSEFDSVSLALTEAQGASTIIFTPAHKSYLPELAPEKHSEDELRQFSAEFGWSDDPGAVDAMRAALETLRHHIGALDDSSVLILIVG